MSKPVAIFFNNYAEALMSFSAEKIADFYHVPVTIYSGQGVRAVTDAAETVAFWKEGVKPYQGQGITKAVPKILSEEQLSGSTYVCKVLWNNSDASGKQVGNETNFYILSETKNGLKISGLILMM
jgi:hypothetical protein